MTINVSILGLYNYSPSIFDNLTLPDGIDKDVLIPDLLSECSDFNLLYPDFDFMKMLIGVWSTKEAKVWEAMQQSVEVEYNPIENYDRYEEITRKVKSQGKVEDSSESSSERNADSTNTGARTSFNSVEFRDTDKATANNSDTASNESRGTSTSKSRGEETVTTHMHGNIGVTTAAQMLEGYRSISNFTAYQFIIDSFKARFCIQIY